MDEGRIRRGAIGGYDQLRGSWKKLTAGRSHDAPKASWLVTRKIIDFYALWSISKGKALRYLTM